MIHVDTSVAVKWFKPGERYEAEALDLLMRMDRGEVQASACEILSLEVVRALKNAQTRQPALGITDAQIGQAIVHLENMFSGGALLECYIKPAKDRAKDIEMGLGLFMADAVHLATALQLVSQYFVVDDHHFLSTNVVNYAVGLGVSIVDLPHLIVALNAASTGTTPPSP